MNKARRHELKMLHFRRRLRKYQTNKPETWLALRSHSVPCSCLHCRTEKYRDRQRARLKQEMTANIARE